MAVKRKEPRLLAVSSPHGIAARDQAAWPAGGSDQAAAIQGCFNDVLRLRQPQAPSEFAATHQRLRERLDNLLAHPAAWQLSSADAQHIAYAVCALADEIALNASPQMAQFWLPRRLQLIYFDDNMAGEGFFTRLDRLNQASDGHVSLQAYYVALALGFQGRYGRQDRAHEISALMASLHETLMAQATLHAGALSPHGMLPPVVRDGRPFYRRQAVAVVGLAALVLLVYGLLAVNLNSACQSAIDAAQALGPVKGSG
jgi:type VI secretion system protein ImpK